MGDSPGFDRLGACVLIVAAACAVAAPASAQTAGQPAGSTARTAWGDPDLQGVWDFASNTPLNRPEAFGDRLLLTDEEAAERQQVRIAARDRQDNTPARAGSTGTYNRFWTDNPRETRQTSLVIDPPNGRVPALTPAARSGVSTSWRRRGSAWTTTRRRRAASSRTSARAACSCAASWDSTRVRR